MSETKKADLFIAFIRNSIDHTDIEAEVSSLKAVPALILPDSIVPEQKSARPSIAPNLTNPHKVPGRSRLFCHDFLGELQSGRPKLHVSLARQLHPGPGLDEKIFFADSLHFQVKEIEVAQITR
jgi:hypothetical protein